MGRHQKYLIKILVCFCIVYTPFFANAGAAEKWELVENVYDDIGKNMSYTAKKVGSAVNDAKYKAKVPVTAVTLGSSAAMLIRGGLASAAIYGIVEGVGWIIDEAGNVKKLIKGVAPGFSYMYIQAPQQGFTESRRFNDANQAVNAFLNVYLNGQPFILGEHVLSSTSISNGEKRVIFTSNYKQGTSNKSTRVLIVVYTSDTEVGNYVPVSDNELGNEILKSPAAPQVIPDIYNPNQPTQTPARDASQDALDKALPVAPSKPDATQKPNKDTDGDGKPDVYDPELPSEGFDLNFEFCEIAAVMCVWYEKYSEDSKKADQQREDEKGFWQKVEDWFDWTKEESETDTNLDIDSPEKTQPETNISFSTSCPAKIPLQFNWNGQSLDFSFDFTIWCQAISTYVYPIVVTLGSLHALYIVTGVRQDG